MGKKKGGKKAAAAAEEEGEEKPIKGKKGKKAGTKKAAGKEESDHEEEPVAAELPAAEAPAAADAVEEVKAVPPQTTTTEVQALNAPESPGPAPAAIPAWHVSSEEEAAARTLEVEHALAPPPDALS
eukprot:CAMPEP_0170157856 /NCGR_PEP_ID=MMETSP0033_2-20121228/66907_1 /TAXON_ID=195969 /ORGANISM="Dolichomastix tenuilepis, Strain CCMP3274" /LENGTH=126 /DNA_ID=CAMNT_0010395269 /DNA_START=22 /DNA_END=398 /DNA_ORIENTATION=+